MDALFAGPSRGRSRRRQFVGALLLVGGCASDLNVPAAEISCQRDAECPPTMVCIEELARCAEREGDGAPPSLLGDPDVAPRLGTTGTQFEATFTVNVDLLADPTLTSDTFEWRLTDAGTDRATRTFHFEYTPRGDEGDGPHTLTALCMDRAGEGSDLDLGAITLDFSPPAVGLAWQLPGGKTRANATDSLTVAGEAELGAVLDMVTLLDDSGATLAEVDTVSIDAATGEVAGEISLSGVDLVGVSFVQVQAIVTDPAGNQSQPDESRTPPLPVDLVAPENPSLTIDGRGVTASQDVSVFISAADASAVMFEGDVLSPVGWFTTAIPGTTQVILSATLGEKTVTARFRDGAWNESATVGATTIFDPTADVIPPRVLLASATDGTHVDVTFNEEIDPLTGNNNLRFDIQPPLTVQFALTSGPSVSLTTDVQVPGQSYVVTVVGVTDVPGNPVDPASDSASFTGFGPIPDLTAPILIAPSSAEPVVLLVPGTIRLAWSPRFAATAYEVEIFADEAATTPAPGFALPIVVTEAQLDLPLAPAGAVEPGVTYWWRVRVATPLAAEDSATGRFAGVVDQLSVYCPASTPCDDTCQMGTANCPFEKIAVAVAFTNRYPAVRWTVRVAGRGGAGPEAYAESIVVPPNITLEGGYRPTFVDQPRDETTIITSSSAATLVIDGVSASGPVVIDAITVRGVGAGQSMAVVVSNSTSDLTIRDSELVGGDTDTGSSYGLYMLSSGSGSGTGPVVDNTRMLGGIATNAFGGSARSSGAYVEDSFPTFSDCFFLAGDGDAGGAVALYVYGGAPHVTDSELHGGDFPDSTALYSRYADALVERSLLTSGVVDGRGITTVSMSNSTLRNSVILGGQCTYFTSDRANVAVGLVFSSNVLQTPPVLSNCTVVAGTGCGVRNVGVVTSGAVVANNIIVGGGAGEEKNYCVLQGTVGQGNFASRSMQNNALTDCTAPLAMLASGDGNCPSDTTADCVFSDAKLNDETTVTGGGLPGTADGNLGPETLPSVTDIAFEAWPTDLHLSGDTPAAIRQGGKDTSADTCGDQLDASCGGVVEDKDTDLRPGADMFFSIGAYEAD